MMLVFVRRSAFLLLTIAVNGECHAGGAVSVSWKAEGILAGNLDDEEPEIDEGVVVDAKRTRLLRTEAQDAAGKPYSPAEDDNEDTGNKFEQSPPSVAPHSLQSDDDGEDLIATGQHLAKTKHQYQHAEPPAPSPLQDPLRPLAQTLDSSPAPPSKALNLVTSAERPSEASPGWLVLRFNSECVQYHPRGEWPLKAATCKKWPLQKFYFIGKKLLTKQDGKCVDHNTTDNKVYLSDCHGRENQQWELTPGKQLMSLSKVLPGKCLEYDTHDNHRGAIIMKKCTSDVLQEWTFKKEASSSRRTAVLTARTLTQDRTGELNEATFVARSHGGRKKHRASRPGHNHDAKQAVAKSMEQADIQEADDLETELADALEEQH